MLIITFNLGRTPQMTFHQQRRRISTQRKSRGIKQRPPRNHFLWLLYIRNDGFERLLRASSHARERQ